MSQNGGILGWVERSGNRLPDPVTIFLILIVFVMLASVVAAMVGLSAVHPLNGETVEAQNLLSAANIQRLILEMPNTLTGFRPLGMVLVVMLGAGVAERAGLFGAGLRSLVKSVPGYLLTPTLVFAGVMSNLAVDAGYVVLIPLGGIVFAAAGRHPVAGMAATFAGVSAGFSANLVPGALEALLFGITVESAEFLVPGINIPITGNWYFTFVLTPVLVLVVTMVNTLIVEPRLGPWTPPEGFQGSTSDAPLTDGEKKGLGAAGLAFLGVVVLGLYLVFGLNWIHDALPPPPLRGPNGEFAPFFSAIVALTLIAFLAMGLAYGIKAGTIKSDRDAVGMAAKGMQDMGMYIVLAFAMAHFIVLFGWSNLGILTAIGGGDLLGRLDLPAPMLMLIMVLMVAVLNLFIGSASAKWALIGPVLVPMLMLQGISPEAATLAYRMGDQATNIITPLMPYLPLVLVFAQRYAPEFGLGSLIATMLPYSIAILLSSVGLMALWFFLDLPLGPGAEFFYQLPATLPPANGGG